MDEAFSADLPAMSNTNALDPANNSAEHPKALHHAKDVNGKTCLFRMLHVPTFTSEYFGNAHHSGAEYRPKIRMRQEKF